MRYKVVVVTTQTDCCSNAKSLDSEVENACNRLASQGYVLITAYPENVKECNNIKRAVFLIFVHPES